MDIIDKIDEMFKKDFGIFIKKLAKLWFELSLSLGLLCLLISLLAYFTNKDYLSYASFLGGYSDYERFISSGNTAYMGLTGIKFSIAAMLSSIFFAIPLYGFGIIVESAEKSLEDRAKLTQKNLEKASSQK